MPLLTDLADVFFRSIVVSTPNEHYLDCATTAFSERHKQLFVYFFMHHVQWMCSDPTTKILWNTIHNLGQGVAVFNIFLQN
jgi:hypothetical protein